VHEVIRENGDGDFVPNVSETGGIGYSCGSLLSDIAQAL